MNGSLRISGAAAIGEVPVFSHLDLVLEPEKWTCLLGASGVGKSTVLKLLAGIAQEIDFAGQISNPSRVALMAQQDLLLPWLSAMDNVMIGARLRGDKPDASRAMDMLQQVGLAHHAKKKPGGLSGGQRQRVALARTLMEDCPTVLLDEPFSALDALTRMQMQDLTAKLLTGRTVLLVTHDPAEAARLGQYIKIMTPTGLIDLTEPSGTIPRPVDSADVLETQARLFRQLRSHQ
ncbi:ABC transporter ATP-binding protein [Cognatiyoonia sp. IB215446]|uniref:ABC transporter ATP-binding protein n=1 Tax=Cognatiyoonia sp. IB215446 TaxID=3097355 RepID=UPI002A0B96EB|nr:ABC transporter ATP-binding protein [Cognatiyoonia sp. IB215446]MDX8348601.1 ABC transporter ATP-binding protein [Cognatiyoonia sp. IB215446]